MEERERSFEEKLKSYSKTAATALMVAPAALSMTTLMPERADAAIQYSGPRNYPVSSANPYQHIDMDGNGTYDAHFAFYPLTGTNTFTYATSSNNIRSHRSGNVLVGLFRGFLGSTTTFRTRTGTATVTLARNLPSGYSIGNGGQWYFSTDLLLGVDARAAFSTHTPGSSFAPAYTITLPSGNFKGAMGYIGVRFHGVSCTGTDWHYGWIRFSGAADASQGTIIDWAYEDQCDTPIRAGNTGRQVTVPTLNQWGLLALIGLLAGGGAIALRRRKAQG